MQQDRRVLAAGTPQDAAVTSHGDIAAGPRVHRGHLASREDTLVGHQHNTGAIAAGLVRPGARFNPIDGIDYVAWTIIADRTMRALSRIAAERHGRVEQEIEPVECLLDGRTALRPDRA